MADDEARARRTTRATAGAAKKSPVAKAATPPARKAPAKKAAPAPKAAPAQKAGARRSAPAAKAAPAKKAGTRKSVAASKAVPAKTTRAAAPRKAAAKKAAPPAQGRGAVLAPRPKKAPSLRLAAEQTIEDEWEAPAPEPPRDDPHARIRSLLRNAALQVEGKAPPPAEPAPEPAQAPASDSADADEVTRVLVAPAPPEEDEWLAEEDFEDEAEPVAEEVDDDWADDEVPADDDDDDWSPPEVLEHEEQEDEMLTVASAPNPRLSTTPAPASPSQTYIPPPAPPTPPDPAPTTEFTPPPFEAKAAAPAKKGGAGRSVLAIVLSVILPVIGAIIGFVLARRARREGAPLAGVARAVSVLLLVAWLAVASVVAYNTFLDEGVDYSELKVGDCFDSSASNEIRGIKVKPCSEPHNSEIFFIVTHPAAPADPYPGKDALVQYAADNCLGQPLTEYLGVPLEQSKLKDFEIVPQESAWKDGRRVLVCGLDTGGEGDITGSVKGTRR